MRDMMGAMGVWMFVWALVGLAVLAVAVLGAVWLARALGRGERSSVRRGETPEEILRGRYARGEIDEDEYLRRISGLSD
ncbi:MAG: SHOCT domain-containing protein [Streptomycetales bacterium]